MVDYVAIACELTAQPYLKNTIGTEFFRIPAGSWIIRGEAAYNLTKDYAEKYEHSKSWICNDVIRHKTPVFGALQPFCNTLASTPFDFVPIDKLPHLLILYETIRIEELDRI